MREWTEKDRLNAYLTSGGTRCYLKREVMIVLHENQGHSECYMQGACLYMFGDGSFSFNCYPHLGKYPEFPHTLTLRKYNQGERFLTRTEAFTNLVDDNQAGYHIGTDCLYAYLNEGCVEMPIMTYVWTEDEAKEQFSKALESAKQWMRENCSPQVGVTKYLLPDDSEARPAY